MNHTSKELVILGLLVLFAGIFWLSLSTFLPTLSWTFTPLLVSVFISAFIFTVLWCLSISLIERVSTVLPAWAISSYLGVFFFQSFVFLVLASLLFFFGIVGFVRARSEMRNTLHGGLWRPLRRAIPLTMTFFIAAVSAAAFLKAPPQALTVERIIPESIFTRTLEYAAPAYQTLDPDFSPSITYREYVEKKIRRQNPDLSDAEMDTAVALTIEQRKNLFGGSISANDRFSHTLYIESVNFLKRQIELAKNVLPLAFAITLFVSLRILAFPFYWLSMAVSIGILRILQRLGIVGLRQIPAQIILYTLS